MDECAQVCFARALDDAGLPDDPLLRSALKDYFRWATQRMSSYRETADAVPDVLPLTRSSWDGAVP
jgi:hemoglobin